MTKLVITLTSDKSLLTGINNGRAMAATINWTGVTEVNMVAVKSDLLITSSYFRGLLESMPLNTILTQNNFTKHTRDEFARYTRDAGKCKLKPPIRNIG